ncbi:MAG: hypothetical protein Q4C34_09010 [Bacteroidales bacterium]|nr:hypothetical protein [Bacteroidales bacterium]
MKKSLLVITLAAMGQLSMAAQTADEPARSIEIGPYTHEAGEDGEDGSVWDKSPVNFHYTFSGSQIIYSADDLAKIAEDNGTITDLSFVFSDTSIDAGTMDITLYVENFEAGEFEEKYPGSDIYLWHTYDPSTSKAELTYEFEHYYYEDIVLGFHLDEPLKYEGNNLLVTVKAKRTLIEDWATPYMFPFVKYTPGMTTIIHSHDGNSFDRQYDTGEAESSLYVKKWVPAVKIGYEAAADGIAGVSADTETAAHYYNLQGVEVQGDLNPGIYICRKGSASTKVMVK